MEARFWSKVKRGADDESWERLGGKAGCGYGYFYPGGKTGNMIPAHRIAWELTHGKIPEGLVVRHRCRGKCVNPNHMELGTYRDNIDDKYRDGTNAKKLTEENAREILRRDNDRLVDLAKEFGVSKSSICDIRQGRTWSHLAGTTRT